MLYLHPTDQRTFSWAHNICVVTSTIDCSCKYHWRRVKCASEADILQTVVRRIQTEYRYNL